MELIQLACSKCNYTADLLLGTQEPGQTFSDLNEDFAFYKLFQCDADGTVLSIDVHDREFDGNCPQHKVKLQALTHFPHACPKCGGPINVTHKDIFKPERGE
jgi:ribosomal protein S27AE